MHSIKLLVGMLLTAFLVLVSPAIANAACAPVGTGAACKQHCVDNCQGAGPLSICQAGCPEGEPVAKKKKDPGSGADDGKKRKKRGGVTVVDDKEPECDKSNCDIFDALVAAEQNRAKDAADIKAKLDDIAQKQVEIDARFGPLQDDLRFLLYVIIGLLALLIFLALVGLRRQQGVPPSGTRQAQPHQPPQGYQQVPPQTGAYPAEASDPDPDGTLKTVQREGPAGPGSRRVAVPPPMGRGGQGGSGG